MLDNSKTAIIISDTRIKNQVATSIAHIYIHDNLAIKTSCLLRLNFLLLGIVSIKPLN